MSGSFAAQGALALRTQRGHRRRAPSGGAWTAARRGSDDRVAETSPGLVLDCLWGPVTKAYFAALRRSGGNTGANTPHVQIGSSAGLEASLSA